jgi:RHS repeat-associated protein
MSIDDSSATRYVVDTNAALPNVLAETDEDDNLSVLYTWGDELISQTRGGAALTYITDGHGDVRFLADENGDLVDFYTYDAFGNLTYQSGDDENSYLYTAEPFDAATGLYYLRARYMNPQTGAFISMDPYSGSLQDPVSLHKYLYANASPVMFTDPTGLFSLADISSSMAIQGALGCLVSLNTDMLRHFVVNKETIDTFNWSQAIANAGLAGTVGMVFGGASYTAHMLNSFAVYCVLGTSSSVFASFAVNDAAEAAERGDWLGVATNSGYAILGGIGAASSFQGAAATPKGQATIKAISSAAARGSISNGIRATTQDVISGTNIPTSFVMEGKVVNGKEVWVHGNATKHMGEFVNSANSSVLVERELMASFQNTVSEILPNVQPGRNFFNLNGWEIGINGDSAVIYHALYK